MYREHQIVTPSQSLIHTGDQLVSDIHFGGKHYFAEHSFLEGLRITLTIHVVKQLSLERLQ